MKSSDILHVNLCLFDGGAAGAAAAGAGEGAGSGTQGDSQQTAPGATRRGNQTTAAQRRGSGEYSNVKFGKQDQPAAAGGQQAAPPAAGEETKKQGVETTSDTLEDKRRAYRAMVDGEYKDQYTEDTQRIIDRRFRETKNLEAQLSQQKPILDMLMQRYKIGDGDLSKLTQAIENDNAYWSQAAEEAGMSVEQYKQFQKLQRENLALRQAQRQRQSQQAAQQQLQKWYGEAEQMKADYPEFDLAAESKDPQFLSMLRSGVPVRLAYEVKHMDEIKAGVAQNTAKTTEKQVVEGIRAKGARPAENGTSSQSAFVVKDDPSQWTKKDRAEVVKRAARGEKIKL